MTTSELILFGMEETEMTPCSIRPEWIIEGAPVSRAQLLSRSDDGAASTYLWDCTAGAFEWRHDTDETIYVIEGSVVICDDAGVEHRLAAGDHAFFRKGTHAVWRVESYVRKLAFCRRPLPRPVVVAKRIAKKLLETTGLRARASEAALR